MLELIVRPLARLLVTKTTPETAMDILVHHLDTFTTLGLHRYVTHVPAEDPVEVMGLRFPNRLGVSAGVDRNGEIVSALGVLGFGHVEIGTVTPVAQPGHPKPRVFKASAMQAVINRVGFCNQGCERVLRNLKSADAFRLRGGIVGISIGKNAATPIDNAACDFKNALRKMYAAADYLTLNISSPNTQRLSELQFGRALSDFLTELNRERERIQEATHLPRKPLAVKFSPDLQTDELYRALEAVLEAHMDGVIVSNSSPQLAKQLNLGPQYNEGGLSGAPLMSRSTKLVRDCVQYLQGQIPVIASGGVMTPEDAIMKIQAGASLVQIHSGLYFKGLDLPADCVDALARYGQSLRQ